MNENERHQEPEARLCDYLDGHLPRSERRRLEKQLEDDEPLREELRKYAALDGLLGGLGRREVEGVDYDRQRAEIVAAAERRALLSQKPRRRVLAFRPLPVGLAAAASLLLVVGVAFLLLGGPEGPANTEPEVQTTASAVSVQVVPVSMAAASPRAVVEMRLAQPAGQTTPATRDARPAVPSGTVVVSSGAVGRKADISSPIMIY
jgi:anti-sigma factor RsiW